MNKKHLAQEIKQHLNSHLNDVVAEVVLFDSQIEGTATIDSDFDVLIILKTEDSRTVRKMINDLCYDFDLKYNIFLDTQIISKAELDHGLRGKHPVFKKAIREGFHA
jgi:predicted nucleotidyltransferase